MALDWIASFVHGALQISTDRRQRAVTDAMEQFRLLQCTHGQGKLLRVVEYGHETERGTTAYIEDVAEQAVYDSWIWGGVRPRVGAYFVAQAGLGKGKESSQVLYVGSSRKPARVARELSVDVSRIISREMQRQRGFKLAA